MRIHLDALMPCRALAHGRPVVLKSKRGSMVDQPESVLPPEEIRVARGSIRIHDESVEPENRRAIVDTRGHQVSKFGIALGDVDVTAELDEVSLRHRET